MPGRWCSCWIRRFYAIFLPVAILVTGSGAMPLPSPAGQTGATLVGRVVFRGTVPPPEVVTVTRDPKICGETRTIQPLVVHPSTRGIQDAVVSIEGGNTSSNTDTTKTTAITNTQCAFSPHVETIRVGTPLEVRNHDPILHNTHLMTGHRTFLNVALVVGGNPVAKVIKIPGLYQVRCDAHPFMQGHLVAFDHPYYAVTQTDGDFRIVGVPAGRHQVTVWHETLGSLQREVTVPAQGDVSITIEFP